MTAYTTPDQRWQAVEARDPAAVGHFVYAVRTTGIYCHPNCKSRLAKRGNVEFFDTPALAEAAGYRACKRCTAGAKPRPARPSQLVIRARRPTEASAPRPPLHPPPPPTHP